MANLTWYLKQLLPFKYESTYRTTDENGECVRMHSTWRMWFGKSFNINHEVVENLSVA